MRLRPKYIAHMLVFSIIIVCLSQQSVIIGIQNLTPKEMYSSDSLVMTKQPSATYPQDLVYCYGGQSTISVSVVFFGVPEGNASWLSPAVYEFSRANITLTFVKFNYENQSSSYYDFEYESKMTDYRNNDGADIVVSFTSLHPEPRDTFGTLAGYSRVNSHISIIFMSTMQHQSWAGYVAIHEMAHLLGYFPEPNGHSSDHNSIMYPVYSGSNNQFTAADLKILSDFH